MDTTEEVFEDEEEVFADDVGSPEASTFLLLLIIIGHSIRRNRRRPGRGASFLESSHHLQILLSDQFAALQTRFCSDNHGLPFIDDEIA